MAIAVIGGLTVSTLLTLFVVPAAYLTLVPFEKKETAIQALRKISWKDLKTKAVNEWQIWRETSGKLYRTLKPKRKPIPASRPEGMTKG